MTNCANSFHCTYARLDGVPELHVVLTVVPQTVHHLGGGNLNVTNVHEHKDGQNDLQNQQNHQERRVLQAYI